MALDATNTVVHRGDVSRSFDRFDDPAEIPRFAAAARGFRAAELAHRELCVRDPAAIHGTVLAIREATDALFRATVRNGELHQALLPRFLRACADGLEGDGETNDEPAIRFEAALAASALSLLAEHSCRRIRICPNCNWLFLDKSRNGSRLWCDMAVCGNRQKAKRHYKRRKALDEDRPHV